MRFYFESLIGLAEIAQAIGSGPAVAMGAPLKKIKLETRRKRPAEVLEESAENNGDRDDLSEVVETLVQDVYKTGKEGVEKEVPGIRRGVVADRGDPSHLVSSQPAYSLGYSPSSNFLPGKSLSVSPQPICPQENSTFSDFLPGNSRMVSPHPTLSPGNSSHSNCLPGNSSMVSPHQPRGNSHHFLPGIHFPSEFPPNLPEQSGTFLPEQSGTFLPEQSGTFLPDQSGTFLPEQSGIFLPEQSGNFFPQQSGNFLPQQSGNFFPHQYGNFLPQQSGNFLPQQFGNFLPQQTGNFFPQQSGNFLPSHSSQLGQIGALAMGSLARGVMEGAAPMLQTLLLANMQVTRELSVKTGDGGNEKTVKVCSMLGISYFDICV